MRQTKFIILGVPKVGTVAFYEKRGRIYSRAAKISVGNQLLMVSNRPRLRPRGSYLDKNSPHIGRSHELCTNYL